MEVSKERRSITENGILRVVFGIIGLSDRHSIPTLFISKWYKLRHGVKVKKNSHAAQKNGYEIIEG